MEISKAEMASAATAANSAASSSSPVDLRGGEILVKALQAENVKYIWGYPGGAVLHIYDAFFKQDTIQHVLVRHEQAAVHAAVASGMLALKKLPAALQLQQPAPPHSRSCCWQPPRPPGWPLL